jgi:hypothetical protein
MRRSCRILLVPFGVSALTVASVGIGQAPRDAPVAITGNPRGTAYAASSNECRIVWIVAYEGANTGVILHRPDCRRPPAEQAPLFGRILDAIAAEPERLRAIRTLHWGRLFPDGAIDGTLSIRVALTAWQSPGWDARAGRPRSGDVNGFIRGLANESRLAPEIEAVFEARGLALAVASVEKVLIARAQELPFFDALTRAGVKPDDRVPWDAQIWFSVREAAARR